MSDDDYSRSQTASDVEFILSPDIPEEERDYFNKWWIMISHLQALGNIEKQDIHASIISFDLISDIMRIGDFEWAREEMSKELMIQQKSRSIGGFQTMYQHGINKQVIEQTTKEMLGRERKKSLTHKISGAFKGKQDLEEVP